MEYRILRPRYLIGDKRLFKVQVLLNVFLGLQLLLF